MIRFLGSEGRRMKNGESAGERGRGGKNRWGLHLATSNRRGGEEEG